MEQLQSVLVVLLGIGFAILLVLGIVMVVIVIKILTNIRRVTQRLDETTSNLNELTKYVGAKLAPAAASAMAAVVWRQVKQAFKRKG
jgi:uncharacterized membrane protein YciS (DUF1049 family)